MAEGADYRVTRLAPASRAAAATSVLRCRPVRSAPAKPPDIGNGRVSIGLLPVTATRVLQDVIAMCRLQLADIRATFLLCLAGILAGQTFAAAQTSQPADYSQEALVFE